MSDKIANEILDIFLHIIVWYAALVCFFYANLKKMENASTSGYQSLAQVLTNGLLSAIKSWKGPSIDWTNVRTLGKQIESQADSDADNTNSNNMQVLYIHLGVVIGCMIIWIGLLVFFRMKGYVINLKRLLAENVVILIVMFGIESNFLTKSAPKIQSYQPGTLFQANVALDEIKKNIGN